MIVNPVINTMIKHKSVRKYKDKVPSDDMIQTIVRAGQQAPFSYQLCSVLLTRNREEIPENAPLLFTFCVDSHRLELVMEHRNWKMIMNDLSLLFFGIIDASLMAENMVIAAASLGLGSCFLGNTPYQAEKIVRRYNLPSRVFPLVQLTVGYPAEELPVRPRFPLDFTLFEDSYPVFGEGEIDEAMRIMDEGYLAQDYYRYYNYMVPLSGKKVEAYNFDNYSWTEHISRKAGQWLRSSHKLLVQLQKCGFKVTS
ncbi:MAG: nitroreductase family protein [Candidatus Cloacimonetes bacterium]|nr:nitroreductase family protein [Candidatus Cloacimonadota bacterium]